MKLGKYELVKKLASGGMGEVWLTPGPGQWLVLKRMHRHFLGAPEYERMFLDEAKFAARIVHPNITRTVDFGIAGEQLYVVMEHVDGRDLKSIFEAAKKAKLRFPVKAAVAIASQVAAGLHHAHTAKGPTGEPLDVVHRDVAPANVMVGFDGAVKLLDFGVAKALAGSKHPEAESNRDETFVGHFPYLSPEICRGLQIDHRTDQFSLAVVLWEALTGKVLFGAESDFQVLEKVRNAKVAPPSSVAADVPPELDEVLLRALSRDRELRYPHTAAFKLALDEWLAGAQVDLPALMRQLITQRDALPPLPGTPARKEVTTNPHAAVEQLAVHELAALSQLAVFRAGFFVEGAEAVVELSGFPGAGFALDVLEKLRSAGAVRADQPSGLDGALRFSVVAPMSEDVAAQPRFVAHFSDLAKQWVQSGGDEVGLRRMRMDKDNLERAMQLAQEDADREVLRETLARL